MYNETQTELQKMSNYNDLFWVFMVFSRHMKVSNFEMDQGKIADEMAISRLDDEFQDISDDEEDSAKNASSSQSNHVQLYVQIHLTFSCVT